MGNLHPTIIQGGMGVGISGWKLARAVSKAGQLGVVSGTALDQVLVRRLHDGDPGGHMRRALENYPLPGVAARILDSYFIPGGKAADAPYPRLPMHGKDGPHDLWELCIAANFVEVYLAREGHDGLVGVNYLEKVQLPTLPSIYGAMLAGVDYVLMGAGIPLKIPGVLDAFVRHEAVTYPLYVVGATAGTDTHSHFSPSDFVHQPLPPLKRPKFLAIIGSNTLAITMVRKANGRVDGFVVEGPLAGGHNAPPRGKLTLNSDGEPIYGVRDEVDPVKLLELGLPFWLAGGYGRPEKLGEALSLGAAGIQAGSIFAFCEESGLDEAYKKRILKGIASGEVRVFTDPVASPTDFPFKIVQLEGTMSEAEVYDERPRICDLGYLREAYQTDEGTIAFRCAAEPLSVYAAKGGKVENTPGRKCICNGLLANAGYPQVRGGTYVEKALITAGTDIDALKLVLPPDGSAYTAADVVALLLNRGAECSDALACATPESA
ncbi:MAG: nitronate monooxygenase [Bryobacteraceae bacterium]|nr:nitronate monooxygenase [Bryobacteraceae bacterium]